MGEGTKALGVANGARCCACFAFLFSLVGISVVAAGAFFAGTEVLALKTNSKQVEAQSSALKSYHAHLSSQLETLRTTSSDLGSRLAALEQKLGAVASPVSKGKSSGSDALTKEAAVDPESEAEGKDGDNDDDDEPTGKGKGKGKGGKGRRRRRNKG